MKKIGLLLVLLACASVEMMAQGASNIRINEVLTENTASIDDEYEHRLPWVELCNVSFSTYNIRGMYITTDKHVLDKSLSAPERQKLMSPIPGGEEKTLLSARQHIVFYLNSKPTEGSMHLNAHVNGGQPLWVALYDGNGVDLIDSVTVPALQANQSYARVKDGSSTWEVRDSAEVTPGIANTPQKNDKIARTKEEDPHGFAITILAMGTVFVCLALLYVFFRLLGILMDHLNKAKKIANTMPIKPVTKTVKTVDEVIDKTAIVMKDGLKSKGIDKKTYIAVIAMALKQYQDDVHDVESGVISIKPRNTGWNNLIK